LISWELISEAGVFVLWVCLGTLLNCVRLIWRISLSLVEVDRWKQAHKHAQKTHKKNTRGRGGLFLISGKSYGSFSLLLPRRPGLVEDRREDKKTRRFSGRTFWTIHLPHPTEANVCRFCFIFFFFLFISLLLSSAGLTLGVGTGTRGDGTSQLFSSFASLPGVWKDTHGEKRVGLRFDRRSNTTYQTGKQGDETGWKHTITPLSLSLMRFTFLLSSNDTLVDDRDGWVGKVHGLAFLVPASICAEEAGSHTHTHDAHFCVVLL